MLYSKDNLMYKIDAYSTTEYYGYLYKIRKELDVSKFINTISFIKNTIMFEFLEDLVLNLNTLENISTIEYVEHMLFSNIRPELIDDIIVNSMVNTFDVMLKDVMMYVKNADFICIINSNIKHEICTLEFIRLKGG